MKITSIGFFDETPLTTEDLSYEHVNEKDKEFIVNKKTNQMIKSVLDVIDSDDYITNTPIKQEKHDENLRSLTVENYIDTFGYIYPNLRNLSMNCSQYNNKVDENMYDYFHITIDMNDFELVKYYCNVDIISTFYNMRSKVFGCIIRYPLTEPAYSDFYLRHRKTQKLFKVVIDEEGFIVYKGITRKDLGLRQIISIGFKMNFRDKSICPTSTIFTSDKYERMMTNTVANNSRDIYTLTLSEEEVTSEAKIEELLDMTVKMRNFHALSVSEDINISTALCKKYKIYHLFKCYKDNNDDIIYKCVR